MSSMPGFRAEESLYQTSAYYAMAGAGSLATAGATVVQPQLCASSPCLRVPSGRLCINLPFFGRKCVTVPQLGSWGIRCCSKWTPPFFSCSLRRCG
jgi:hypothetical protein